MSKMTVGTRIVFLALAVACGVLSVLFGWPVAMVSVGAMAVSAYLSQLPNGQALDQNELEALKREVANLGMAVGMQIRQGKF